MGKKGKIYKKNSSAAFVKRLISKKPQEGELSET
jgi:hypothetical protein